MPPQITALGYLYTHHYSIYIYEYIGILHIAIIYVCKVDMWAPHRLCSACINSSMKLLGVDNTMNISQS